MTAGKVWLDYDQRQLDDQYDQRVLVPDANDYMARHLELSERVRAGHPCRLDVAYGPGPDETLDIFPTDATDAAPVAVYFHGGAWTRWHKDYNSYQAPAFTSAGVAFVSVNFSLAPAASLDGIVGQCRAAVAWVHANAGTFGADPARLFVAGHSSGAHLAGLMAVTDWPAEEGLPADAIKGAVLASGMYELEPVRLSARNAYLGLDAAAVDRLSAMRHLPGRMPPVGVAYGGGELDEFRRQSREFAQALKARGDACRELDLAGLNHFQVAELYADAESDLMRAVHAMVGVEH